MKIIDQHKILISIFLLFAGFYLISAIIGGVNGYSPVPFWDMWQGYIDFYFRIPDSDVSLWWEQHNEHRIVLSRILFWLDFELFNGSTVFLIVINYILAGVSFLLIYKTLALRLPNKNQKFLKIIFGLIIFCFLFSWKQYENFTWAFQSQFFLATLMPLAAFLLLYNKHFFWACIMGALAWGTMANGIIGLPLMMILALLLRMKWWQILTLLFMSVLSITLYFYDFQRVGHHNTLSDALLNNPRALLEYTVLYLGGPFYSTFVDSICFAKMAGTFLIISSLYFAYKAIKSPKSSGLELMILVFLLYIGGTALGTGGGRINFGVEQALSSRYATPALMAWSALLVLYAPMISNWISEKVIRTLFLMIPLLLLLPQQFKAIHHNEDVFIKNIAGMSLAMKVKDNNQISLLFPHMEVMMASSELAEKNRLSFFNDEKFKDMYLSIKQKSNEKFSFECQGYVDNVLIIPLEDDYVMVNGWLFEQHSKEVPNRIYFLNTDREIIGHGLTGSKRTDVALAIDPNAKYSGFKGYVLKESIGNPVIIQGIDPGCELPEFTLEIKAN